MSSGAILLNPAGGCGCAGECTIHLLACDGTGNLAGAAVTIKDAGGATVDSGTTDASGNFTTTAGCGTNRTVTVAATGYTTHDFTGQTLSATPLNLNMAGYLDPTNYVCCGGCAFPKLLHYSWTFVDSTGTHTGSSTATYRNDGTWWAANFFSCLSGAFVKQVQWLDEFGGTQTCYFPPTSLTCDPLNVVFHLPTEEQCPGYAAASGVTSSTYTVTA